MSKYTTLSEEAISYICGLLRDMASVSDAVDDIYNSSGISKEFFNGSSSGTAVTFSLENDSGFIYNIYRQLERWVNRYIKAKSFNTATFKFSFYLLDVTIYNKDKVATMYKDACTLGFSVIDKWYALLGMTPSKIKGNKKLLIITYKYKKFYKF